MMDRQTDACRQEWYAQTDSTVTAPATYVLTYLCLSAEDVTEDSHRLELITVVASEKGKCCVAQMVKEKIMYVLGH